MSVAKVFPRPSSLPAITGAFTITKKAPSISGEKRHLAETKLSVENQNTFREPAEWQSV